MMANFSALSVLVNLLLLLKGFFQLIRLAHSHDPDFSIQCSFTRCSWTLEELQNIPNDCLKHSQCEPETSDGAVVFREDDLSEGAESLDNYGDNFFAPTTDEMQMYAAKWILKTRETRSLTRAAMQGVLEDVQDLVHFVTQTLECRTHLILQANGIVPSTLAGLSDVFSGPSTRPFEGLTSFHQQLQYCHVNLGFIVSLFICVTLCLSNILYRNLRGLFYGRQPSIKYLGEEGNLLQREEIVYILPLLEILQCLLSNTDIWREVYIALCTIIVMPSVSKPALVKNSNKMSSDQLLGDYRDARVFSNHSLFSTHPSALQLMLCYDEL